MNNWLLVTFLVVTSHLIGHRFGEIEPFSLLSVIDVAQSEVVLLHHIQLLADVVQQVLSFVSRLQMHMGNNKTETLALPSRFLWNTVTQATNSSSK